MEESGNFKLLGLLGLIENWMSWKLSELEEIQGKFVGIGLKDGGQLIFTFNEFK
jgi:hypothetical protein